eukprot:1024348-Pelagomonas_calceolata.AAC.3
MDDSVLYKMNLIEVGWTSVSTSYACLFLREDLHAVASVSSTCPWSPPQCAPFLRIFLDRASEKAIRAHFGVANVCPKTPDPNPRALPARFPEAPEEEFYKCHNPGLEAHSSPCNGVQVVPCLLQTQGSIWHQVAAFITAPAFLDRYSVSQFREPGLFDNVQYIAFSLSAFYLCTSCRVAMRAVCLPCAGSAEDFCRNNGVEVLAAQPPGRGMRIREPYSESAQVTCESSFTGPRSPSLQCKQPPIFAVKTLPTAAQEKRIPKAEAPRIPSTKRRERKDRG